MDTATVTHFDPVLRVENLSRYYPIRSKFRLRSLWNKIPREWIPAVDGISFSLSAGETLGVVGESGCGKSTLSRCLVGLDKPHRGTITVKGIPLLSQKSHDRLALAKRIQMVFQDPYTTLNPRWRIWESLAEPLRVHRGYSKSRARQEALEMMEYVSLDPKDGWRYPHQFSGGQRQRVGIGRALIMKPDILVLDEPVSALDVSVQASILNALQSLQKDRTLSCIFVSHNLAVVNALAQWVMVIYLGQVVESGRPEELFSSPLHPYTQALVSSIPKDFSRNRNRELLKGDLAPVLANKPGCRFQSRCPKREARCSESPPFVNIPESGRHVRCWLFDR